MNLTLEPEDVELIAKRTAELMTPAGAAASIGTLEAAGAYDALRQEIKALSTPWRTRDEAAAHLRTTHDMIDRLADAGQLTRYFVGTTPRFLVSDLNLVPGKKKEAIITVVKRKEEAVA